MHHLFAIAGLSDFDSILISGIVTVVGGVAGLITWVIKSILPKFVSAFERRNEAWLSATEKTVDAVNKIPIAIKSFEMAMLAMEKRIGEKIDGSHEKVLEELRDKRISDLTHAVSAVREAAPSRPGG